MEPQLAITMELDSTDTSMELGRSSDPNISLQSRRHSYLEEIRSLPVVSAGGSSSSSRSARSSSYYSSSKSSGGSRHRYVPYSSSSRRLVRLEDKGPRDIARRMVRDGFMGKLVGEFGRAPISALDRWFSELDVGFVLPSALEKEKGELALDQFYNLAVQRWARGITVMAEALSATQRYLQEEGSTVEGPAVFVELPTAQVDRDDLRLVRFVEATVCKMLAFADALAAYHTWHPMDKFSGLMDVRISISEVSRIVMLTLKNESLWLPDSEEMQSLINKIGNVFIHTKDNLDKATLTITNDAKAVTPVLSSMYSWETFPQSAEIHEATQLIMDYARLFLLYEVELVRTLQCWPNMNAVSDIVQYMIINLIDHLEKKSESLSDPSLRYLFLLNNSYFIQDQIYNNFFMRDRFHAKSMTSYSLPSDKYRYYQNCYLDVSWDPMLSCLHGKMPLWFSKPSQLARFETEFQTTCRHQKLWKVPNPKLRQSLREAIIDKVITGPTGYKKYLEAHPEQEKCSSDPQDMEDMVNELFEG
ncbi:hypothetical protein OsI_30873 [Oryza sativa Indica Group]|uniref:Exocyst subunit Exo70 family protein n=1 Tax=Oryza sativa subsp. indica TaxID=39946 RepID=A2YZU1_ORYSI|nr:hypothetical protein OsI_30873 [Oryza sativa Indica Group]